MIDHGARAFADMVQLLAPDAANPKLPSELTDADVARIKDMRARQGISLAFVARRLNVTIEAVAAISPCKFPQKRKRA